MGGSDTASGADAKKSAIVEFLGEGWPANDLDNNDHMGNVPLESQLAEMAKKREIFVREDTGGGTPACPGVVASDSEELYALRVAVGVAVGEIDHCWERTIVDVLRLFETRLVVAVDEVVAAPW